MDLHKARDIERQLRPELEQLFNKYGLKVNNSGGRVDTNLGIIKYSLELREIDQTQIPEEILWHKEARIWGLPVDALGKTITIKHTPYKIIGMKVSGRLPKVALRKVGGDDRTWFYDCDAVKRLLPANQ